jgi:hypothetical protein
MLSIMFNLFHTECRYAECRGAFYMASLLESL